jgi:hypothetical protein
MCLRPSDNEATRSLEPIVPHHISIAPNGSHVLCALETHARAGTATDGAKAGGRDLLSWGLNYDGQLGNGRKNTLAVPTQMHVPHLPPASAGMIAGAEGQGKSPLITFYTFFFCKPVCFLLWHYLFVFDNHFRAGILIATLCGLAGPAPEAGASPTVDAALGEGARLMLRKRRADLVRDMTGKVWKKGVEVEQIALAGEGCSVVYWRLC